MVERQQRGCGWNVSFTIEQQPLQTPGPQWPDYGSLYKPRHESATQLGGHTADQHGPGPDV